MNKEVFLDLDGVLVDFSAGLCKLFQLDPYEPEVQAILKSDNSISGGPFGTIENVDAMITKAGYDFWINLELLPWSQRILDTLNSKNASYSFLTSPSDFSAAGHAKIDYIRQHFNSKKYILTKYKYFCANSKHLLVDDYNKNIREFKEYGGETFRWPCPWALKESSALLEQTFQDFEKALDDFLGVYQR